MNMGAVAIAFCLAMVGGATSAAEVTKSFNVSLTDFQDIFSGVAPPLATVDASFTLTFDPTANYTDETTGLVVNSINTPVSSPFAFTVGHFGSFTVLAIGGLNAGAGTLAPDADDFGVFLEISDLDAPILITCDALGAHPGCPSGVLAAGYSRAGALESAWLAGSGAVPEQGAWVLMILGFGAAGVGLRRKLRVTRAAA